MKLARFLALQALILGTAALIAWSLLISPGLWAFRLSVDTLAALGFAVLLTALFLLLIALPVQALLGRSAALPLRLVVGALSSPLGVWLGLLVLSSYPIEAHWYIIRSWALHAVYAGVGACFALAWHRRLRPNNSFKPTPLRGAA